MDGKNKGSRTIWLYCRKLSFRVLKKEGRKTWHFETGPKPAVGKKGGEKKGCGKASQKKGGASRQR